MSNARNVIVFTALAVCVLLFILLQVLNVHLVVRIAANALLFAVVPLVVLRHLKQPWTFFTFTRLEKKSLVLGLGVFLAILLGNFLFKQFIDTDGVIAQLGAIGITLDTYLWVALHVIVVNSFLEELFFRGFSFLALKPHAPWAGWFSAALFSVYHVAIFGAWFVWWVMGIALVGLFVGGLIFNWLNAKSGTIYNSWFVHIMADVGVIVVGLNWFGVF